MLICFLAPHFWGKNLSNLMHFQEEKVYFIPQKRGAEKRKYYQLVMKIFIEH